MKCMKSAFFATFPLITVLLAEREAICPGPSSSPGILGSGTSPRRPSVPRGCSWQALREAKRVSLCVQHSLLKQRSGEPRVCVFKDSELDFWPLLMSLHSLA